MTDRTEYVTRQQLEDVVRQLNGYLDNVRAVLREQRADLDAAETTELTRFRSLVDQLNAVLPTLTRDGGEVVVRVVAESAPHVPTRKRVETDAQGRIVAITEEPL